MKGKTLDEILDRLTQDFINERKQFYATSSGTEQFEEQMEKYERKNFDNEER